MVRAGTRGWILVSARFLCDHQKMKSIVATKKTRGRPRVDSEDVHVRMERPMIAALDAFSANQGEPVSRPEIIRRVLADHLRAKGYLPTAREVEGGI